MNVFVSKLLAPLTVLAVFGLSGANIAAASSLPEFVPLVEQYGPAVVNISTTQKSAFGGSVLPKGLPKGFPIPEIPEDNPLYDLFKHFFEGQGGGMIPEEELDSRSLGSGFFISADGYVLTNHHVVEEADEIIVRTSDGKEHEAKLVGSDKRSDIALLKLDATGMPTVKLGTSKNLKVGEWVLAIGSPFGFDHSATAGIVSAMGRSLPSENYVPFIQTDVAINPGNSGGPLFNLDGEVVGVNSQIYSRTGGFMGLSFAIPVDVAMDVVEQLKSTGHVTRGWLGVMIQDVNRELAESFGMSSPKGALVAQLLPGSPAEKSGIRVGDVILKFNGKEIGSSSDLPPIVGQSRIDEAAKVEVLRDGQTQMLDVVIGELPAEEDLQQAQVEPEPGKTKADRFGLVTSDIPDEVRTELDAPVSGGVLVDSLEEGAAFDAGIREGDLILMLNDHSIKDLKHYNQLVRELPKSKQVVRVLVQRKSGPIFLALKLGEN